MRATLPKLHQRNYPKVCWSLGLTKKVCNCDELVYTDAITLSYLTIPPLSDDLVLNAVLGGSYQKTQFMRWLLGIGTEL